MVPVGATFAVTTVVIVWGGGRGDVVIGNHLAVVFGGEVVVLGTGASIALGNHLGGRLGMMVLLRGLLLLSFGAVLLLVLRGAF